MSRVYLNADNGDIFVTGIEAVENIFDIRYPTTHSRIDASGRNFLFGLELLLPKISSKQ